MGKLYNGEYMRYTDPEDGSGDVIFERIFADEIRPGDKVSPCRDNCPHPSPKRYGGFHDWCPLCGDVWMIGP